MGLLGRKKKLGLDETADILVRHAVARSHRVDIGAQCILSMDSLLEWEEGALSLQYYAGYIALVAFAYRHDKKGKKNLAAELTSLYVERWSSALDNLESPPKAFSKAALLVLADQQRVDYDRIIAESPSMQLAGYEHSRRVGARFDNNVSSGDGRAAEYGQKLFQTCVESCLAELAECTV